jgi:hypothetical protein
VRAAGDVELALDEDVLRQGIRDRRRFASEYLHVRLPYRFRPNPVAGELEYLSVSHGAFTRLRSRATSLFKALRGEMELLDGDVEAWVLHRHLTPRVRDSNPVLWKTMVLASILDAARSTQQRHHVIPYFEGTETVGVALARLVGTKSVDRDNFENFLLNRKGTSLEPLSRQAILRLEADALLHATRTANNARVGEIYLLCFLAVIAFWELGGAAFLALLLRTPTAVWLGEGFGVAAGVEVPFMQAVFAVFMGFVNHVRTVGDILADGEVAEEEMFGYYFSCLGLVLPLVFAIPAMDKIPAGIQRVGQLGLLPVGVVASILAALGTVVGLVGRFQQLLEGVRLAEILSDQLASNFIVADPDCEIVVPGMPE